MSEEYISGEQHREGAVSARAVKKTVTIPVRKVGLLIFVLAVGLISFFSGSAYGKHHANPIVGATATSANGGFSGRFRGGRGGGFGQVTAISNSSISIQNQRTGNVQTFTINGSTSITDNGQSVTVSDIQDGETVIIRPTANGSSTAASIIVNPNSSGPDTNNAPLNGATSD